MDYKEWGKTALGKIVVRLKYDICKKHLAQRIAHKSALEMFVPFLFFSGLFWGNLFVRA